MSLSQQDYERLSAYMDDALDADARAALEARLESEGLLRSELESLRRLRALSRALPTYRAPRDFTLTPAMLQNAPPNVRPMPPRQGQRRVSLRWLSAAAAVAVAILFVVALLPAVLPDTSSTAPLGGVAVLSTASPEPTPTPRVIPTLGAAASMPQPTAPPTQTLDQSGTGAAENLDTAAESDFADPGGEGDEAAMMEEEAAPSAPAMTEGADEAAPAFDAALDDAAELESAGDPMPQGRSADLLPPLSGEMAGLLAGLVLVVLMLLRLL